MTPKGYEPHNPNGPRILAMDGATWVPMQVIPPGDPQYFAWVSAVAAERARLKPWTLVSLRGEVPLVAVRRTFWWRLVTAWHNVWRRRERRRVAAEVARANAELARRLAAGESLADGSQTSRVGL